MSRYHYYLKRPLRLFSDVERWVAYRTYDKYHTVNTGLEKVYWDKPEIILHANFSLLVDFVEVECAGMQAAFSKKNTIQEKIRFKLPAFIERIFLPHYRSESRGLEYISWHIKEHSRPFNKKKDCWENKGKFEKWQKYHLSFWEDVKKLYFWWTVLRPMRIDSSDVVGLTKFTEKIEKKYGSVHKFERANDPKYPGSKVMVFSGNKTEEKEYHKLILKSSDREEKENKEDDDMLIRLMKIRRSLWT